mmetsp:Transcript_11332/g.36129  ORF Transcript_11332/g.36129 Transcript_11332/m.36129 type:complete len:358 (+) Transcript_11332:551-1624(+)
MHGLGTRTFANGSAYEGAFIDGAMHGEGMMHWANKNQYVGIWKDNMPHGRGVVMYGYGDRFEGLFFKGAFFGRGRYTWSDGGFYEGAYLDQGRRPHSTSSGKRNGYGMRWWVSGNRYEGEWLDDQMEGLGKLIGSNGSVYTGPFRQNQKSGWGKEQWGNQLGVTYRCGMKFKHKGRGYCRYEGEFQNGVFHGHGTYTCIDGREYVGNWCHGRRSGEGTMVLCPVSERGDHNRRYIGGLNGLYRPLKYTGAWVNGKRMGPGELRMMDGVCLEGHFEDGLLEGHVDVLFPDGGKRAALFEFGRRVGWTDGQKGAPGKCWADVGIDRSVHKAIGKDLAWLRKSAKANRLALEANGLCSLK